MRSVQGKGWSLKRGTTLVGRVQSGQNDRAYVNLVGYIDPATNKLVTVGGELLSIDGASGLKGERRRVGSRLARVLSTAAQAGIQLGNSFLLGRNGGTYYGQLPTAVYGTPTTTQVNANSDYVAVPAGTLAYVLISDLPSSVDAEDAQGEEKLAGGNGGNEMTDQEVLELISTGTPEQIKAALPRMNPRIRAVVENALKTGRER